MKWLQSFRMAFKSIAGNKIRATLTMLGIIIGVGAVIGMVSLIEGATRQIKDTLQGMGTNLISINVLGRGSTRTATAEEIIEFAETNSDVIEGVAPLISGTATVKYGNKNLSTNLEGTNEAYRTVRNTDIQEGRFFNALDIERRQKVVLIGTYISQELFGNTDPVGQNVKINGEIFKVIGILETKSNSTAQSGDDKVIIPYTTASRLQRNSQIRTYYVQGKTPETVDRAMQVLEAFLFKKFNSTSAYRVFNQADMLESISETTKMLTMMLGGIAGISLLVGGIGIMNIMLVTVSERTREIGIRKAI
ncbi:MAG TPA: ABC transporter permease, partial [Clostridiales bacterium]|nr:ABC transporter permease [Clostridiales bacterium]